MNHAITKKQAQIYKSRHEYVKLAYSYNTFLNGFHVPCGAIYGRTTFYGERLYFICTDYKLYNENTTMQVYIAKTHWTGNAVNENTNKVKYNKALLPLYHPVCVAIQALLSQLGFTPKVKAYKAPETAYTMSVKDRNALGMRKHPQPKQRCYKQGQVDGKMYTSMMYEDVYTPCNLPGEPVAKGIAPIQNFENPTLWDDHKDGMKVNQAKIRPSKENCAETCTVKVNGIVTMTFTTK